MAKIFISYRRQDATGSVGHLSKDLRYYFKEEVFRDIADIEFGEDFEKALARALESCSVMLAVIGPRWLEASDKNGQRRLNNEKDWVRLEIAMALKRGIRVIPILLENTPMPSASDLPEDLAKLASRHKMNINEEGWDADIRELVRGIAKILGRKWVFQVEWLLLPAWVKPVGLAMTIVTVIASYLAIPVEHLRDTTIPVVKEATNTRMDAACRRSDEGITLFIAPYDIPQESGMSTDGFNRNFPELVGLNIRQYLSELVSISQQSSTPPTVPEISTKGLAGSCDKLEIASGDMETARKIGGQLNALGIITGHGELDQSKKSMASIYSTFVVVPRYAKFQTPTIDIQDAVPVNAQTVLQSGAKLGTSWGTYALIAYVVKELSANGQQKEKLEQLQSLLGTAFPQEGTGHLKDHRDSVAYQKARHLQDHIGELLQNVSTGAQP